MPLLETSERLERERLERETRERLERDRQTDELTELFLKVLSRN